MKIDKAEILARLDAATVASHYAIAGRWSGRWLRSRSCGRIADDAQPAPWPIGGAP